MPNPQIQNQAGKPIQSFSDWEKHALPPDRRERHWKEGRSAFELGRSWTANGEPAAPGELIRLLESHDGTRRTVVLSVGLPSTKQHCRLSAAVAHGVTISHCKQSKMVVP